MTSLAYYDNKTNKNNNNNTLYRNDTKLSNNYSDSDSESESDLFIPPPLPLLSFDQDNIDIAKPLTLDGSTIHSIENIISPNNINKGEHLYDPILSKKLSKYFINRSLKEISNSNIKDQSNYSSNNLMIQYNQIFDSLSNPSNLLSNHITFDSNFESGNLNKVFVVNGRENLLSNNNTTNTSNYNPLDTCLAYPNDVNDEFDLYLSPDTNTIGNTQWFYFHINLKNELTNNETIYPYKVRFNIMNLLKRDSLYNYGMKPVILNSNINGNDWVHDGYDICYYKNLYMNNDSKQEDVKTDSKLDNKADSKIDSKADKKTDKKADKKNLKKKIKYYILSFSYEFKQPGSYYFAHSFPYTYSDLQKYLNVLDKNKKIAVFMTRKLLCHSIAGNRCDLLTVTERTSNPVEDNSKPAIILTARVHPGESNSSYMMHGFINFITSDHINARRLRKCFVFKIIPMLNPDGVIHGNYRCSLIGTDLNRRYVDPSISLHPIIYALVDTIKQIQLKREILFYFDLHGHSKKKNTFFYGNDITQLQKQYANNDLLESKIDNKSSNKLDSKLDSKTESKLESKIDSKLDSKFDSKIDNKIENDIDSYNYLSSDDKSIYQIFTRILPKICCKISNASTNNSQQLANHLKSHSSPRSTNSGYFSYNDCSYQMQQSKLGTSRIVSFRYFQIIGSYTIEISFCGNGNNQESKIIKKYFELYDSEYKEKYLYNQQLEKEKVKTLYQDLISTYSNQYHYCKNDLLTMGKDLALSIYYFCNINIYYDQHSNNTITNQISINPLLEKNNFLIRKNLKKRNYSIENLNLHLNDSSIDTINSSNDTIVINTSTIKKLKILPQYIESMRNKPLLTTAIFSNDAIDKYQSLYYNNHNMRLNCEIEIRNELNLNSLSKYSSKTHLSSHLINQLSTISLNNTSNEQIDSSNDVINKDDDDAISSGSDSEPSLYNIKTNKIFNNINNKNKKLNILQTLRKYMKKNKIKKIEKNKFFIDKKYKNEKVTKSQLNNNILKPFSFKKSENNANNTSKNRLSTLLTSNSPPLDQVINQLQSNLPNNITSNIVTNNTTSISLRTINFDINTNTNATNNKNKYDNSNNKIKSTTKQNTVQVSISTNNFIRPINQSTNQQYNIFDFNNSPRLNILSSPRSTNALNQLKTNNLYNNSTIENTTTNNTNIHIPYLVLKSNDFKIIELDKKDKYSSLNTFEYPTIANRSIINKNHTIDNKKRLRTNIPNIFLSDRRKK